MPIQYVQGTAASKHHCLQTRALWQSPWNMIYLLLNKQACEPVCASLSAELRMGTSMKSGVSETGIRTVCWQCTNFNYCHWKGTDSRYQVLAPDDGFKFDALKGIRSGQFTVITAATPLSGCALQPALVRQHFAPMGSTWVFTRGAQGTTQDV